jgi:hypothetical protein
MPGAKRPNFEPPAGREDRLDMDEFMPNDEDDDPFTRPGTEPRLSRDAMYRKRDTLPAKVTHDSTFTPTGTANEKGDDDAFVPSLLVLDYGANTDSPSQIPKTEY